MDSSRVLLLSGVMLLSISALLGFVQERHRDSPEAFARWRVVHAGGAAGAVQLIALAAVWGQFDAGRLDEILQVHEKLNVSGDESRKSRRSPLTRNRSQMR